MCRVRRKAVKKRDAMQYCMETNMTFQSIPSHILKDVSEDREEGGRDGGEGEGGGRGKEGGGGRRGEREGGGEGGREKEGGGRGSEGE
jgi:hypothetical protein